MDEFTPAEYALIRAALNDIAQQHKECAAEAEARAADPDNEFRKEALAAAQFHVEQRHEISLLVAKVFRAEGDADRAARDFGVAVLGRSATP